MQRLPEILAPVGTWDMLRAAVHNGADAVYMGMPGFNARGRAPTLDLRELEAMIAYAHLYGVRVFLAFNILLFERELSDAIQALSEVIPLKPDAFIVQDIGVARLIRFMAPEQIVHASTQMTVTSSEAIQITEDLGMARYVLGREVSVSQMEQIRQATNKELEVFVHGALCVSYSGQCLTSESMGGRSANRGQCAQSCRLPYELIVDGKQHTALGHRNYMVSPQDLCGLQDIPRLLEIGIDSLKIEGRLKSPEYVASTTRAYSERSFGTITDRDVTAHSNELARIYSRGFFNGWFDGVNHQQLVNGYYSSHHGLFVGKVESIDARSNVIISSVDPLVAGDGVVFKDPSSGRELGGAIFTAHRAESRNMWRVTFSRDFPVHELAPGIEVYINSSPQVESKFRNTFTDKQLFKKIPLVLTVTGSPGEALHVTATDDRGNTASTQSTALLQPATKAPLTEASLAAELGALGGTVFRLKELTSDLSGSCFIHTRELKDIRRSLCAQLEHQRINPFAVTTKAPQEMSEWILRHRSARSEHQTPTRLNVLVRDISQLEQLQDLPLHTVYLDFEFGKEYATAAEKVRQLGYQVGIATTRIFKPGELGHLKVIERIKPDEVLVRNLGALQYLRSKGLTLIGDFSLNVANSLTADWFLEKGLTRISPSYDLNGEQLLELSKNVDTSSLEITAHHYIPAFHMEHCVFAAFLSSGSSYKDCGRPCEKHRVELRDTKGGLHPLKADAECRNTMFNGYAQSVATLVPQLREAGVATYRVEALFESASQLREKVVAYADLLHGRASPSETITRVGAVEKIGVTDGQLYNIRSYSDRKKSFTALADLGSTSDPGLKAVLPPDSQVRC